MIQVRGEQVGVPCGAETRQRHAVGSARAADLALQQQCSQTLAEVVTARDCGEPCRGPPLAPAAFEEDGELGVGDSIRISGQGMNEGLVLLARHTKYRSAELQIAARGGAIAAEQSLYLRVVADHHPILSQQARS